MSVRMWCSEHKLHYSGACPACRARLLQYGATVDVLREESRVASIQEERLRLRKLELFGTPEELERERAKWRSEQEETARLEAKERAEQEHVKLDHARLRASGEAQRIEERSRQKRRAEVKAVEGDYASFEKAARDVQVGLGPLCQHD